MKKLLLFATLLITSFLQAEDVAILNFKSDTPVIQEVVLQSHLSGCWEGNDEWTYMKGMLVETAPQKMIYVLKKFDSNIKTQKVSKGLMQKTFVNKPINFSYKNKMLLEKNTFKALDDASPLVLLEMALFHTFMAQDLPLEMGETYPIEMPDSNAYGFFTVRRISKQSVTIDFKMKNDNLFPNDLPGKCKCEGTARFDRKNAYIHDIEFKEKRKLINLFTKESKVSIRSYPKL